MRLKLGFALLIIVVVVLVMLGQLYKAMKSGNASDEQAAIQKALAETKLVHADRTDPFIWEEPYTIVFGRDSSNKQMIVWVGAKTIHSEYAADGRTREQLLKQIETADNKRTVMRMTPGIWNDNYVWEVFYHKEVKGQTIYYYDFYRFKDGQFLITFTLAKP